MQEIAEAIGIAKLKARFETDNDEEKEWYKFMFPRDNLRNTRYAINFFTSIGLGPLTDGLREFLKNAPKLIMEQAKQNALVKQADDDSSSVLSSSSESSSSSSSSSSMSSSSSGSSSVSSRPRRRRQDRSASPSSRSSRSRSKSRHGKNEKTRKRSRSYSPIESRRRPLSKRRSRRSRTPDSFRSDEDQVETKRIKESM
jgi:pre-mRNA-splicing factor CWC22